MIYNRDYRAKSSGDVPVLIDNNAPFIALIAQAATARGLRVAAAESCTGGMVAAALTNIPGASQWFAGGVIAYDNAVKESLLRVPQATLAAHGAVSEETAARMCEGVMALLTATAAVAVSGIAGPGGGGDKPVGTVCFGLKTKDGDAKTWTANFGGGRNAVRTAATTEILKHLADALKAR